MYFVFVTTGEKRKNVKVGHLAYQRTTLVVSTRPWVIPLDLSSFIVPMWSYKIKGTTVLTADPNKYNRLPSLISKMRWNRIRLRNTQHWQVGSSQLLWHITQTEAKMKESNWRKEKGRCHSLGFISFSQNIKQKQNLPQYGGKREHGHFFLTTTKLIKTGPTVTGLIRMKKKESKRNSFYFILLNLHFGIHFFLLFSSLKAAKYFC